MAAPCAPDHRFPPYGVLNMHFRDVINEHPLYPNDWTGLPNGTGSLYQQWRCWADDTLDILADVLWPRFDVQEGWCGAAREHMQQLTDADLRLMKHLRHMLEKPVAATSSTTHREFFENEDTQAKPFASMHSIYDPTLPFRLIEKMPRIFQWSLGAKAGTAAPQLKRVLQRPRAYQIAAMRGIDDFLVERAISGDSPSMPAGHPYEGGLSTAGIIERFLLDRESLSYANWLALQQYAVDVGDRRVFAGVHYPSDNLSSWIMMMRIADQVFRAERVKEMLWTAISELSHVFAAIQTAIDDGWGSVYAPAVEALKCAAGVDS